MSDLDSKNLDLQEQVQALEERLELMYVENKHTVLPQIPERDRELDLSQTLESKDQYILKLEAETKVAQEQYNKLVGEINFKVKLEPSLDAN